MGYKSGFDATIAATVVESNPPDSKITAGFVISDDEIEYLFNR